MPDLSNSRPLKQWSPTIATALGELRSKIRKYVCVEGISLAIVWLCLTFWLFVAVDYLPVILLGRNELSLTARLAFLGLIGAGVTYLLYQYVARRVFARLKDQSLALLLERTFPQFEESLITTVQAAQSKNEMADEALVEKTRQQAEAVIQSVDIGQALNRKPLNRMLFISALSMLSVGLLTLFCFSQVQLAGKRLYLLDSEKWPRQCNLEMVGVKVKRENLIDGIDELNATVEARSSEFLVAKGASLTLLVRAETGEDGESTPSSGARQLPGACTMFYRTAEGERGQQTLKKIGAPRDGFQMFSLDGQPLQGMLTDLTFSIRGGDHRIGPYRITVVDLPTVTSTDLACEFPAYMVDEVSMRWTPRTIRWSGHSQLPQGTNVQIQAQTNKELEKVYAYSTIDKTMNELNPDGHRFEFLLPTLWDAVNYQFYLCDQDGVVSEIPHSVSIQPIEDEPPTVQTRLNGIGSAVTPDVRIPFTGTIEDDYGVNRQWVTIETSVVAPFQVPFETSNGKVDSFVDFKERRQASRENVSLPTGEGSELVIMVEAEDRFDLADTPNIGLGDRYVLDIVSAGELLRILERLEVGQRRRLEQIFNEVADARGYLVRSKSKLGSSVGAVEPGDREQQEDLEDPVRRDELRLLFAQRAIVQVEKSTQEILGVAFEFEDIRKQLVNNRVDSEDRKQRLADKIVAPLRLIAQETMQQLEQRAKSLEESLGQLQSDATNRSLSESADEKAILAIEKVDLALEQLTEVLSVLVKYETQNELLDIVRRMIKQQEEINERTKKERKKKAFDGLLDDE